MNHQILIASYKRDFPFLRNCLRSIHRFSRGFLPPSVVVTHEDAPECRELVREACPAAEVRICEGPGMLRAQYVMMNGDVFCPSADVVHLVGSDCLFFKSFDPSIYMRNEKPLMLYTSYSAVPENVRIWQINTEKFLGWKPEHEFMRRLPLQYPRALFPQVRRFLEKRFKQNFKDVLFNSGWKQYGQVSESNIMGAYAFRFLPHLYEWLLTDKAPHLPESPMIQFWSHGGPDRPSENCAEYAPGKRVVGQTPRAVITEILGSF